MRSAISATSVPSVLSAPSAQLPNSPQPNLQNQVQETNPKLGESSFFMCHLFYSLVFKGSLSRIEQPRSQKLLDSTGSNNLSNSRIEGKCVFHSFHTLIIDQRTQCAQSQRDCQIKIRHITSIEGLKITNVRTIVSCETASLLATHTASLILLLFLLVVLLLLKKDVIYRTQESFRSKPDQEVAVHDDDGHLSQVLLHLSGKRLRLET